MRIGSLSLMVCLTLVAVAQAAEVLTSLPEAPQYQISNLRMEQDRFGKQVLAFDFRRTRKGKGSVQIKGKSSDGPLSIAASVPSFNDSGTIRLQSLFSNFNNNNNINIEFYLAQPVRWDNATNYMMVSNSIRLGNPGPPTKPRAWTEQEKVAYANHLRIMTDDSAHKPNKAYPVSVKPPADSVFVPNTAKLVQGTRLHACYQDDWHPLTTISENADGTVNVTWDKYGRSYDVAMNRGELIIANSLLASLEKHPSNKYPVTKPNIVDTKEPPPPVSETAKRRKSYKVTIAVPSDSQVVPADLKLKEGVPLQACYAGKWNPLTTLSENDDGSINVRWDAYGAGFDCSMVRDELIIKNDVAQQLRTDPDFKPEIKPLKRKSYPVTIAVPSDSLFVPPSAKVAKGTKLQACWAGKWNPITAISEASDGTLNVHWDAFGDSSDCSMLRTELIIKKAELRASSATEGSPEPVAAALRTWKDSTGTYEIRAKLLRKSASEVTLEREDGKQVTLPVDKLSAADQQFLREGDVPKPANPFAP